MNRIQQVKSKKRVADHGEVFTNEREVNAMLDLVSDMFIQIDKTFLEPACGDGNFLIEILKRKLSLLDKYRRCSKTNPHCEKYGKGLVQAVCSLYGIDLLPDNVACCRDRLFYYIERTNPIGLKKSSDYQDVMKTIRFILEKNIICGNALDNKHHLISLLFLLTGYTPITKLFRTTILVRVYNLMSLSVIHHIS